jgi:hypothetical protein
MLETELKKAEKEYNLLVQNVAPKSQKDYQLDAKLKVL